MQVRFPARGSSLMRLEVVVNVLNPGDPSITHYCCGGPLDGQYASGTGTRLQCLVVIQPALDTLLVLHSMTIPESTSCTHRIDEYQLMCCRNRDNEREFWWHYDPHPTP